jgi:MoaE-MoaD fusion protein
MITVRLFAMLRDRAGASELATAFDRGTVAELLRLISLERPVLAEALSSGKMLVSVNQEFAGADSVVKDGDEVALMPPFSGGDERRGSVRIQREPFSADRETERLKKTSTSIGALVTFMGTTRDISRGKEVARLDFEHYPGMAEKILWEIRERAVEQFGVIDATIVHRIGAIPVGEDIVFIAVAAGHRDEAFAACRFCIDELKRLAPIWKKETTPDGEVWVEEHP